MMSLSRWPRLTANKIESVAFWKRGTAGAGALVSVGVFAQPAPPYATGTNRVIVVHPVSPIEYFRELLAMNSTQRLKALEGKTVDQQKKILAKIAEYEQMSAEERELRLRHTELRWQLTRLMRLPPLERMTEVASLSADTRSTIEERLRQWDRVPLPLQKEFLENEAMVQRMLNWEATPVDQRAKMSPEQREKLRTELAAWRNLPEEQRHRMSDQFRRFFELSDSQKKAILGALPPGERDQMQQALQKFESLAPEMRERCIQSFSKIAAMSAEERSPFLKNAERWGGMSPAERRAWRDVVYRLPPMPPPPPFLNPPPVEVVSTNASK